MEGSPESCASRASHAYPASISASNLTIFRFPPLLRMHRQHVDDVGPMVAPPVAVPQQARGNRVAVGLVAVGVALETMKQFEPQLPMRRY